MVVMHLSQKAPEGGLDALMILGEDWRFIGDSHRWQVTLKGFRKSKHCHRWQ